MKLKLQTITPLLLLFASATSLFAASGGPAAGSNPIGTLDAPSSIITNTADIGPIFFTNIIRLIIALAGIWSLFQFLLAGFAYITGAGDSKKTQEAITKITHAIIGLVIITISFLLAGIVGFLFFDNPMFILNPTIQTN